MVRTVVRVVLVVGMMFAATLPTHAIPPAGEAVAQGEVRIRKLHLVRPDLIPYPIAYEVVC
jgi:hypothetical protein